MLTVVAVAAFLPRAPACSPAGRVCLGCCLRGRFSLIEWGIEGYLSVLLQKYREGLAVIERSLRQELITQDIFLVIASGSSMKRRLQVYWNNLAEKKKQGWGPLS